MISKNLTYLIAIFITIANLSIILNIPILRQVLGFFFLTILPGFLIIEILNLYELEYWEKFVLAVGLSISFLMLFGLFINTLFLAIGYPHPLSTNSLLVSLNIIFILIICYIYTTNKSKPNSTRSLNTYPIYQVIKEKLNLAVYEKAILVFPILLPALSLLGTYVLETKDANYISMLLLVLIPMFVVLVCIYFYKIPPRDIPVMIISISLSLVLLMPFRSNHILGIDSHVEYYFFKTTLDNLYWSAFGHHVFDACLSISLLPTIYQSILNSGIEIFFKIFYPLIYSILPLIIYIISLKYLEGRYAFLASCLFMFQTAFLNITENARTSIALVFFALAMMVFFNDRLNLLKVRILFLIFTFSCVISHYSTTYIFFFILLGTYIGDNILSSKFKSKKRLSLTVVFLLFVVIFFWYYQITGTAFELGVRFIEITLDNLKEFFNLDSRENSIQALFGMGIGEKTIPHKVEFLFTWMGFMCIGIGVCSLIRSYRKTSFPEIYPDKVDFLIKKFEVEYIIMVLLFTGFLVLIIMLPFISFVYGLDRLYSQALIILSVIFIIGGITIAKYLNRLIICHKTDKDHFNQLLSCLVILLIMIPYFFCATGFIYQIFNVPKSIILSSEGYQYDTLYIHEQESYGAKWLKSFASEDHQIFADFYGSLWLQSQGNIPPRLINSHWLEQPGGIIGYIYLRRQNIVNGVFPDIYKIHNASDLGGIFNKSSKIYHSGNSIVYTTGL